MVAILSKFGVVYFKHYVFNALKLVQIVREQLNRTMLINTC